MVLCSDRVWRHTKNFIGAFNGIFNEQQYLTLKSIRTHLQTQVSILTLYKNNESSQLVITLSLRYLFVCIQIRSYANEFGKEVFKNYDETKVVKNHPETKTLKPKQSIQQSLGKAVKKISSTELMQRIFNVLEDIGI